MIDTIICFDYSKSVIDLLIQQQKQQRQQGQNGKDKAKKTVDDDKGNDKDNTKNNDRPSLAVQYQVLDARTLPYPKEYFDLIMDKGTLDAMLSDKAEGKPNCIKIVAEASRVLVNGGKSCDCIKCIKYRTQSVKQYLLKLILILMLILMLILRSYWIFKYIHNIHKFVLLFSFLYPTNTHIQQTIHIHKL